MNALEIVQNKGLLKERLCLDFTNTTGEHPVTEDELLTDYSMLVYWSLFEELLTEQEADFLLQIAASQPEAAARTLHKALTLRETLYRILASEVNRKPLQRGDMQAFHQALAKGFSSMCLARTDKGCYRWEWSGRQDDLACLLHPVVWDAADLLQSPDLQHLRQCMGEGCDWLFLDTSRNHTRCWCNMRTCGNRAKVRTHYQRKRSTELLV